MRLAIKLCYATASGSCLPHHTYEVVHVVCSIWPWALEVRRAAKGPGGPALIIHWDLPMEARGHRYQESKTPTDTDRCTPRLSLTLEELAQQTLLSMYFLTQKENIYRLLTLLFSRVYVYL